MNIVDMALIVGLVADEMLPLMSLPLVPLGIFLVPLLICAPLSVVRFWAKCAKSAINLAPSHAEIAIAGRQGPHARQLHHPLVVALPSTACSRRDLPPPSEGSYLLHERHGWRERRDLHDSMEAGARTTQGAVAEEQISDHAVECKCSGKTTQASI
jgi:hypothetical protein